MKLFSNRKGLTQVRQTLQLDEIDAALRNGIWNALTDSIWGNINQGHSEYSEAVSGRHWPFLKAIWAEYFRIPTDSMPTSWKRMFETLRKYYFGCKWYEVYDFIEFIANTPFPYSSVTDQFIDECNVVLERELSGYRFVGKTIAQLTSEQEISEIEKALDVPDSMKPVRAHLQSALDKFADKKSPDYRNSIKESISAVESLCNLIRGTKTTLGDALKDFKDLHPALRDSFIKLYGYTSDAQGIRHSLLEEPNLNSEDAKYMLVACSAFINFLVSRSARQGLML